ncbi:MAG: hypothetical protein EA385_06490 [Salinarimonadaceae bacterium]|nr:MAG: hypothetical protein EA385_06490 [Salinarimonadaceae bacterium]
MAGPMNWDEYGETSRAAGNWAKQVFACFTTPAQSGPPPADLLARHKAYVASLETDGSLFLAGPLSDEEGSVMSGAGLVVLAARDMAHARSLAAADPMHEAGFRRFVIQAWRLNEGTPIPGLRLSRRSFDG